MAEAMAIHSTAEESAEAHMAALFQKKLGTVLTDSGKREPVLRITLPSDAFKHIQENIARDPTYLEHLLKARFRLCSLERGVVMLVLQDSAAVFNAFMAGAARNTLELEEAEVA